MLSPADRQRYARHLLLVEIGEAGQARLRAAPLQLPVDADPRASSVAREYLERAGVGEGAGERGGTGGTAVPQLNRDAVRVFAGDPQLEHAAAAVLGALHAVEVIKAELGLGTPLQLPAGLQLAAESCAEASS